MREDPHEKTLPVQPNGEHVNVNRSFHLTINRVVLGLLIFAAFGLSMGLFYKFWGGEEALSYHV